MPIFLTQNQIYRLIQRELPEDVFPDGPASAFYHTAEMFSYGLNVQSAYQNASGIYQNFFPQSCDAATIAAWEIKVFGQINPNNLTLLQRQNLILAKLQSAPPGISHAGIVRVVNDTIPGLDFEVLAWCCGQGAGGWVLDVSQLDLETYFNYDTQFAQPVGPQLCNDLPSKWGMTTQDWQNLQQFAYTYEVDIFTHTLTPAEFKALDAALLKYEPARCGHVINSGLDPSLKTGDGLC